MTANTTVDSQKFLGEDENGPYIGLHIQIPNEHANVPGSPDFNFVDMKFQGEGTDKVFTLGVSAVGEDGKVDEFTAKVVFKKDINSSSKFVGHIESENGGTLFNAPESVSKLLSQYEREIFQAMGQVVQPVTEFTESASSIGGAKPLVTDTKDPGNISASDSTYMQLLLSQTRQLKPATPGLINNAPQL